MLVHACRQVHTRVIVAANAAAEILDALRGYLWILLAAAVVWRLFPIIRTRIESEDFSVEIAGQKVSFQSASTQLQRELDDLRSQVIAVVERLEAPTSDEADEPAAVPAPATPESARNPWRAQILWVDDQPQNNAFLVQSLNEHDAVVITAVSTDDALAELESNPGGLDLVISDMGRVERGSYRELAGVDLIRRMRKEGLVVPVVIYASTDAVARGGERALEAGAVEVTSSPTELVKMVRLGPQTSFEASVAEIVRDRLDAKPFPIRGTVDFVAKQDGERVGIEIKNWTDSPTPWQLERSLRPLRAAHDRLGFSRILLLVRSGIDLPADVDLPPWINVLTVDELVASLDEEP